MKIWRKSRARSFFTLTNNFRVFPLEHLPLWSLRCLKASLIFSSFSRYFNRTWDTHCGLMRVHSLTITRRSFFFHSWKSYINLIYHIQLRMSESAQCRNARTATWWNGTSFFSDILRCRYPINFGRVKGPHNSFDHSWIHDGLRFFARFQVWYN